MDNIKDKKKPKKHPQPNNVEGASKIQKAVNSESHANQIGKSNAPKKLVDPQLNNNTGPVKTNTAKQFKPKVNNSVPSKAPNNLVTQPNSESTSQNCTTKIPGQGNGQNMPGNQRPSGPRLNYNGANKGQNNYRANNNNNKNTSNGRNSNFDNVSVASANSNNQNRGPRNSAKLEGTFTLNKIKKTKTSLPNRPGFCTIGQPVLLKSNCWDLAFEPKDAIMYDFEVISAKYLTVDFKVMDKELRDLQRLVPSHFKNNLVYDGGKIIFSLESLKEVPSKGQTKLKTIIPNFQEKGDVEVTFKIQKVQEVSSATLIDHVKNKLKTFEYPHESIRYLDCIFRGILQEKADLVIRNSYFNLQPKRTDPRKLMNLHLGMITSIRPQWKIRLNINMKCKAFFPPGNLADILYDKYEDRIYDRRTWMDLRRDLKHIKAFTTHNKTKEGKFYKKKVTIHSVSNLATDQEQIPDQKMSISDYFLKEYNIKLKYPNLPAIKTHPVKNIMIPMELLTVFPFQAPNASKSEVTNAIVRCAAVRPEERFNNLDNFVKTILKSQHQLIKTHKINLSPDMVKLEGRVLPCPKNFEPGCWNQNNFKEPALSGTTINWIIVSVIRPNARFPPNEVATVAMKLPQHASKMGLKFGEPEKKSITSALVKDTIMDAQRRNIKLLLFILYDDYAYGKIKFYGDLTIGMVTQCIKPTTIGKSRVFENLLLKINSKLGGLNWEVPYCKHEEELLQVFGMDVSHPNAANGKIEKSMAAVTASTSANLMKYSAIIREQNKSQNNQKSVNEIIEKLDVIVENLIRQCAKENNKLPNRLIFYRDGVSEGQFKIVLVDELAMIQRACTKIQPGYEPGITFITVQKRHQVRFMKVNEKENLDPGTVIDTEVTHPSEFDFYLCSHKGIQGTSSPSHYYILYDDNDWSANQFQTFTYALCYAYVRCTMSVSIPAPTYYSHLAAFRARDWKVGAENEKNYQSDGFFNISEVHKRSMFFV